MIDISHVLVLSQNDFLERRVIDEISGGGLRWPALRWPFGRR